MLALALAAIPLLAVPPPDADADGDGLSDFHERHKHRTDPARADSDGDGIPDGDWLERREFAYTVRLVVDVLRPLTPEHLTDDFQDARVLDETGDVVQLEVVLYPFSTAPEALADDARADTSSLGPDAERWLAPGPTSDWDPELRADLLRAVAEDGIDATAPLDAATLRRVATWLVRHAEPREGRTVFVTAFDEGGERYVPEDLRDDVERVTAETGEPLEEQWAREVSAKGMFERGVRGSCSPSSIYLSGCLRALGVPTRTVLCIPAIDANDEREVALLRQGIEHPEVRGTLLSAAQRARGAWTSHSFNEVRIGGRWWRLDYDVLGRGILVPDSLGLMVHVATFRDWADARMPETLGRRQTLDLRDARLDGPNPYSTISIRDAFGEHSGLEPPAPVERRLHVARLFWSDDPALHEDIQASVAKHGRFGLFARVTGIPSSDALREVLGQGDRRVWLEAPGAPRLGIGFDPGCWWYSNGTAHVYLPFGAADRRDLREGVEYAVVARNRTDGYAWEIDHTIVRGASADRSTGGDR
jgi:transglutaminase-like putative cysteine protease